MQVMNLSTFRSNLKAALNSVTQDAETVIINRSENQSAVLISLKEYNAIQETLHLLSTEKNRQKLFEAIERDKTGVYVSQQLIED